MKYLDALRKAKELLGPSARVKATSGWDPGRRRERKCRVGRQNPETGQFAWTGHGDTWEQALTDASVKEARDRRDREKKILAQAASWAERTLLMEAMGYPQLPEEVARCRRKVEYDRAHPGKKCGRCGRVQPTLDMRNADGLGFCCYSKEGPGVGFKGVVPRARRYGASRL